MTPEDIEKLAHEINKNKEPRIQLPALTVAHLKWITPMLVSLSAMGFSGYNQMGNVATEGVITGNVRPELKRINKEVRDMQSTMDDLKDHNSGSSQAIVGPSGAENPPGRQRGRRRREHEAGT